MHNLRYLIFLLFFYACQTGQQESQEKTTMSTLELFEQYITGDFDNQTQISQQLEQGAQIHPYARHINRRACDRITNAPERNGFWILEESYYQYPDKDLEIKPYLFFFEEAGTDQVRLHVYNMPEDIPVQEINNDNDDLTFDYADLRPSPSFQPATYDRAGDVFKLHAPNDLGNGLTFTLIETISADQLIVMELLERDGQRLTPYDTPILYDRL